MDDKEYILFQLMNLPPHTHKIHTCHEAKTVETKHPNLSVTCVTSKPKQWSKKSDFYLHLITDVHISNMHTYDYIIIYDCIMYSHILKANIIQSQPSSAIAEAKLLRALVAVLHLALRRPMPRSVLDSWVPRHVTNSWKPRISRFLNEKWIKHGQFKWIDINWYIYLLL